MCTSAFVSLSRQKIHCRTEPPMRFHEADFDAPALVRRISARRSPVRFRLSKAQPRGGAGVGWPLCRRVALRERTQEGTWNPRRARCRTRAPHELDSCVRPAPLPAPVSAIGLLLGVAATPGFRSLLYDIGVLESTVLVPVAAPCSHLSRGRRSLRTPMAPHRRRGNDRHN